MTDSANLRSVRPESGLAAVVGAGAFESIGIGVYAIDPAGLVRALNPKAAFLLGWTAEQCEGLPAHETFHLGAYTADVCPILAVARTGLAKEMEADLFRRFDGSLMPVWWTATPIYAPGRAEQGAVLGALVAFADTTAWQAGTVAEEAAHAQVRSDLGAAREAVSDLGWAAEVTQALASAPDEWEALQRLARMAVPRLCEVIVVHRIDDTGRRQRASADAAAHLRPVVERALDSSGGGRADPNFDPTGLQTARAVTLLDGQDLASSPLFDAHTRALLDAVGARSAMVVPMVARGHLVAVAEMINTAGAEAFQERDRLAAMDLARRIGLAVDNLRLLQAERSAAVVLQEALLPVLTDRPGLRLACRYLPARDIHRVGGDWYDAFASPDDPEVTMLVVGDVAGHDLAAATSMAAIRNLLRGIAVTLRTDPAGLLAAVDEHLRDLGITATATAVVATVSRQQQVGGDPESPWRLLWSNAGHLPPILVGPDGSAERLESPPDPLLGSGTAFERTFHARDVAAGSTLVFYTDGLIERVDEDPQVSLDKLVTALEHTGTRRSPQVTLDQILQELPRSPDDDTAVLVANLD